MRFIFALSALLLAACSSLDKPYLFKASKVDREITLFGTIHAGVPGWDLPKSVTNRLDESNRAYFETDLEKASAASYYYFSDQKQLDERLTPAEFKALGHLLPNVKTEELRKLKAMTVMALLPDMSVAVRSSYEARSASFENGLDFTLFKRAREREIPIETLDSDKYEICEDEIEEVEVRALQAYLKGQTPEQAYEQAREIVKTYRAGNDFPIKALAAAGGEACILGERNTRWAALLEKNVGAGEKVFVAVGVGHIYDPNKGLGLLSLLRKQGFEVTRLK